MRKVKEAKDLYGHTILGGDVIVFSWGGALHKAQVSGIKLGSKRASLEVFPLNWEGKRYTRAGVIVTAQVKDSMSTVKI